MRESTRPVTLPFEAPKPGQQRNQSFEDAGAVLDAHQNREVEGNWVAAALLDNNEAFHLGLE